jgi:hypothetical protein
LLFTLLWLFSLRNNSALQSNTEMEGCFCKLERQKNKESNACVLFVRSGFKPKNSAVFVYKPVLEFLNNLWGLGTDDPYE